SRGLDPLPKEFSGFRFDLGVYSDLLEVGGDNLSRVDPSRHRSDVQNQTERLAVRSHPLLVRPLFDAHFVKKSLRFVRGILQICLFIRLTVEWRLLQGRGLPRNALPSVHDL